MESFREALNIWRTLGLIELVILALILILIILGNTMVLVATWKERALHQPDKYFIACLAAADLLFGLTVISIRLYELVTERRDKEVTSIHLCRFYYWVDAFLETASIYSLTFISFDRFLKIRYPFQYKSWMTASTARNTIFTVWLIAATYGTLGVFSYADNPGIFIKDGRCLIMNKVFHTFAAVSAFFLPTAIMLIMYVHIFFVVHKRQRRLRNGELGQLPNSANQRSVLVQDIKTIRVLVVIVGAFFLCWGPFFIYLMIFYYHPIDNFCNEHSCENVSFLTMTLQRVAYILPKINSLLNPIIYAYLDRKYKAAFKHLLQPFMIGQSSRVWPQ